ncbi:MAG: HAMP domain-containing histidine kinase [Proteobacteria bacterium]|nr:HAMP domain-containing histidine kinase [Pseudomonadota bacterium]
MFNPRKWLVDRSAALTLAALALPGLVALWIGVDIHRETRAAAEAARAGFVRLTAVEDMQGRLQSAALAMRDGLNDPGPRAWDRFDDAVARLQVALQTLRDLTRPGDSSVEPLAQMIVRGIELWREFRELDRLNRTQEALDRITQSDYRVNGVRIVEAVRQLILDERAAAIARQSEHEINIDRKLVWLTISGAVLACLLVLALRMNARDAEKRAADAQRWRLALDTMSDGLIYYDENGALVMSNPRVGAMFPQIADVFVPGMRFDEVLRRAHAAGILNDPAGIDAHIERRREERRMATQRRELVLTDGRTILLREANTPEGGRLLVLSDVTAEKSADRAKADFVSTVSHELRTPLTSISGALALVGAGTAGDMAPKARQLVDIANRNAERLARLVDDLLQVQRLEAPIDDLKLVPVPLDALLDRAAREIGPMALKRGVHVARTGHVPGDVLVWGDEHRLIQVLHNLLSNAVKFSPAGERVELAARRGGDHWRVAVSDRGPGIPPAFRGQVFQRFAQADSGDTRARGGTGLGLSIAKAIVDKLGGRISFETEMGTGTTFTIELSTAEAERSA